MSSTSRRADDGQAAAQCPARRPQRGRTVPSDTLSWNRSTVVEPGDMGCVLPACTPVALAVTTLPAVPRTANCPVGPVSVIVETMSVLNIT